MYKMRRRYAVGTKHLKKVLAGIGMASLVGGFGIGGTAVGTSG